MNIKRFMSKKVVAIGLAAGITLGMGGAAFAYFTSTGSGVGAAKVGSATSWTVAETAGSDNNAVLYPDHAIGGANIEKLGFTVTNPGSGSQNLTSVTVQIATSSGGVWSVQTDSSKPACTAADFSIDGGAVGATATDTTLAGDFTAGQVKVSSSTAVTVEMIDNVANQDNCQGVTPPLYFYAS